LLFPVTPELDLLSRFKDDTRLTAVVQDNPVAGNAPFWILLKLRMKEVVVKTGAVRHAKLHKITGQLPFLQKKTAVFFLLTKSKTITLKQFFKDLWHFLVLINSRRYELLICLSVLLVYATLRTQIAMRWQF